MIVDDNKFNEAYHHFQRLVQEAKELSIKIQRCCREMIEAISEDDKEDK